MAITSASVRSAGNPVADAVGNLNQALSMLSQAKRHRDAMDIEREKLLQGERELGLRARQLKQLNDQFNAGKQLEMVDKIVGQSAGGWIAMASDNPDAVSTMFQGIGMRPDEARAMTAALANQVMDPKQAINYASGILVEHAEYVQAGAQGPEQRTQADSMMAEINAMNEEMRAQVQLRGQQPVLGAGGVVAGVAPQADGEGEGQPAPTTGPAPEPEDRPLGVQGTLAPAGEAARTTPFRREREPAVISKEQQERARIGSVTATEALPSEAPVISAEQQQAAREAFDKALDGDVGALNNLPEGVQGSLNILPAAIGGALGLSAVPLDQVLDMAAKTKDLTVFRQSLEAQGAPPLERRRAMAQAEAQLPKVQAAKRVFGNARAGVFDVEATAAEQQPVVDALESINEELPARPRRGTVEWAQRAIGVMQEMDPALRERVFGISQVELRDRELASLELRQARDLMQQMVQFEARMGLAREEFDFNRSLQNYKIGLAQLAAGADPAVATAFEVMPAWLEEAQALSGGEFKRRVRENAAFKGGYLLFAAINRQLGIDLPINGDLSEAARSGLMGQMKDLVEKIHLDEGIFAARTLQGLQGVTSVQANVPEQGAGSAFTNQQLTIDQTRINEFLQGAGF